MKKTAKKLIATVLCTLLLVTLCSAALQAYAWTNISSVGVGFSILSGTGHIACDISAYPKVTKVTIQANLQQKVNGSWKTIATWNKSANATNTCVTGSKALTKGYDYRLQAVFTATSPTLTENHTTYSPVRTY